MNKIAFIVTAALLSAGCAPQRAPTPEEVGTVKLIIKGSNTFGEELAPQLIAGFNRKYPNVTVELESKATAVGFAALLHGEADIAAASRMPSDDEVRLARSMNVEFNRNVIGFYGVAVIVHASNPVEKVSHRDVRDLFTGRIGNWAELEGGPNLPVHVCIRDSASGTHLGFREIGMGGQEYAPGATTFTNYETLVEAVIADPAAIGYASMVTVEDARVGVLAINGFTPSVLSVNEGHYPLARTLTLNTLKSRESPAAIAFIRFVQSPEGQQIVSDAGFVRRFERRLFSSGRD
jgi:phosphate transport system substrate-binding protein